MPTPQDPHAKDAEAVTREIHPPSQAGDSIRESLQQVMQELPALSQQLNSKPGEPSQSESTQGESTQDGALLFLDEADALFGKRTDVNSGHDRFFNQEGLPRTETPVNEHGQPLHHDPPK